VPQALQTLCGWQSSLQLVQATNPGNAIFHVWARLLSRLAFEIFPFGQIIVITSVYFGCNLVLSLLLKQYTGCLASCQVVCKKILKH